MDNREKLIKDAISHFNYGVTHDIFSEPVATYVKLASAALEYIRYVHDMDFGKWIPVAERLPEEDGEYNVIIHKGATPTTLMYNATTQEWFETIDYGDGEEGYTYYPVEYWTPLPEPPKEN